MNIINDNDYCYFDLFWRMVVAFLHFVINSSDNIVSKQQSLLFILTLSKLIIVEWLRLALTVYRNHHQQNHAVLPCRPHDAIPHNTYKYQILISDLEYFFLGSTGNGRVLKAKKKKKERQG